MITEKMFAHLILGAIVVAIGIFLITDISALSWLTFAYIMAITNVLDTLSTLLDVRITGTWDTERNELIQKWGQKIGYGNAIWIHTLAGISLALIITGVIDMFLPPVGKWFLFFLSIVSAMACTNNLIVAYNNYRYLKTP